nr:MAG TPA: hypothetical protein [Caudoviricetes sp.]
MVSLNNTNNKPISYGSNANTHTNGLTSDLCIWTSGYGR